jgi:hypothetical protein
MWMKDLGERLLRWIEPEDNPSAVVYGTIAVGLVLAAEDPTTVTYPKLVSAVAVAIVLYWLAHSYAAVLGRRFTTRHPVSGRDAAHILAHEWALVRGAAVPLVVLLVEWAVGIRLVTAITVSVWTAAVALLAFEIVAGTRARLRGLERIGTAAVGAALGVALLAVKLLLH